MSDDNNHPTENHDHFEHHQPDDEQRPSVLMSLLRPHSGRRVLDIPGEDLGLAENLPYPFMALVGQVEMRTALLLAVVNPNVGGVLLIGPRGIGKTTAARGLSDLLPFVEQSACEFGCMPEDYEAYGRVGVCESCAAKLESGRDITRMEPVRLIELPLNARLEDVVGGVNQRAMVQSNIVRLDRGLLARADQNILYIDEVNLLPDVIVDAILDAAAQGRYTVRRGAVRATYRSRFVLVGSMNPEEGNLRPQILDRFGLRVVVTGLIGGEERSTVYRRVHQYRQNPRAFIDAYAEETYFAREDVIAAREILPAVKLEQDALDLGIALVQELAIHSHRAEFTMFEAARAYAALDQRTEATTDDLAVVAPLALRIRRSQFIDGFIDEQQQEEARIETLIEEKRT